MDWLRAALLGLVQGVTEFLPISSSGHLVLFQSLLDHPAPGVLWAVVLHGATLCAVLAFYRRKILDTARGVLRGERGALHYALKLALATLPVAAIGLVAREGIEARFEGVASAGWCLLATGFALRTTRHTLPRAWAAEPTWVAAWWIGCAQAVAILPGISRSGATVCAALALGLRAPAAAQFSFLLSVPAIAGALLLQLPELKTAPAGTLGPLTLGCVVALGSGLASLFLFLRLLRAHTFHRFAYYVWVVGAAAVTASLLGVAPG